MGAAKSAKGANPKCTGAADPKCMVPRAKKSPPASAKGTRWRGDFFDPGAICAYCTPPREDWFAHRRDEDSNLSVLEPTTSYRPGIVRMYKKITTYRTSTFLHFTTRTIQRACRRKRSDFYNIYSCYYGIKIWNGRWRHVTSSKTSRLSYQRWYDVIMTSISLVTTTGTTKSVTTGGYLLKSRGNSYLGHILSDLIHSLDSLRDCGVITHSKRGGRCITIKVRRFNNKQ